MTNSLNRATAAFSLKLVEAKNTDTPSSSSSSSSGGGSRGGSSSSSANAMNRIQASIKDEDTNTILKYLPLSNSSSNSQLLPEYLQEGIDCEPSMAPVILSDVLHSMYNNE